MPILRSVYDGTRADPVHINDSQTHQSSPQAPPKLLFLQSQAIALVQPSRLVNKT